MIAELKLNGAQLNSKKIAVSINDGTSPSNRNIYFKNLPNNLPEQKLKEMVTNVFKQYGKISSMIIDKEKSQNQYYGFVCFEDRADAEKAVNALNDYPVTLDGSQKPLFVGWAQTKPPKENCSLFMKDLKTTLSEDEIRKNFAIFGKIAHIHVKDHFGGGSKPTCKFAVITYQNEKDAQSALQGGKEILVIQKMFIHSPYIVPHEGKEEREKKIEQQNQNFGGMKKKLVFNQNANEFKPNNYNPGYNPTNFYPEPKKEFVKQSFDQILQGKSEEKKDESLFVKKIGTETAGSTLDEIKEELREKLFNAAFELVEDDQEAHKIMDAFLSDPKIGVKKMQAMLKMGKEQIMEELQNSMSS